jgi:hypothetical protein
MMETVVAAKGAPALTASVEEFPDVTTNQFGILFHGLPQ